MFIVTRRPYRTLNAEVLNSKVMLDALNKTCMASKDILGERLFLSVARENAGLNSFVDGTGVCSAA